MEAFAHNPIDLERLAFRLLQLFKGTDAPVECKLFDAYFDDDLSVPYDALSYAQQGTDATEHVTVNGRRFEITGDLYLALHNLRFKDADRILWVDTICVDMGNVIERNHQILQRGRIFSGAEQVNIWLGPETFETNVLFDSLILLEKEAIKEASGRWAITDERWESLWLSIPPKLASRDPSLATSQRRGMLSLLERPWFKRVWTLLEVSSARSARVYSGSRSVSARIFAVAPLLLGMRPEPHCQAVLDLLPGPSRKNFWRSGKLDLYSHLVRLQGMEARDPRDIIYVPLSMSNDRNYESLHVDYEKSVQKVIQDTASFLFGLAETHYSTMSDFLSDFTALNTLSLGNLARSDNATKVADFLETRGGELKITEDVLEAVVQNEKSGMEIMALLLGQRENEIEITEGVVKAAASNTKIGKDMISLLINRKRDQIKITEEIMKAAKGNVGCGTEILTLLHDLSKTGVRDNLSSISDNTSAPASIIFSLKSVLSTAITDTGPLTQAEKKRATDLLASIFLSDPDLKSLLQLAIKHRHIGPERLERNFTRLVKVFSQNLKEEARDASDLELANFIRSKARLVAIRVREILLPSPQIETSDAMQEGPEEEVHVNNAEKTSAHGEAPVTTSTTVENYSNTKDMKSISDDEPEEQPNERFAALVDRGRNFIEASNAWIELREDLQHFVVPLSKQSHRSNIRVAGEESWQKTYSNFLAFLSNIGLRDESIPPGHQRIRWKNRHGKNLYDDYIECDPGALQALQEYLSTSAYRTEPDPDAGQSSAVSHGSGRASTWTRSSDSGDITDQVREFDTGNNQIKSVQKDVEKAESPARTLHLMSCTEKGRYSVQLHQELITHITNDQQLFHELRCSYHRHKGRYRPYWSLRTVHSIHFMQFDYGGHRHIDVRCHYDICGLGEPYRCIPPADLVPKKYECSPIPPRLCPPVGPRLMMDFFTDPNGVAPDATVILQRLPKKADGELRSQTFESTEAWGIYFKEDWDWVKIWWVLGIGFFPPSLLFGVLWGILKKDIQGAFGVASWWMTGATILVGIVGTCSWTT